jgi:hypothetical protein
MAERARPSATTCGGRSACWSPGWSGGHVAADGRGAVLGARRPRRRRTAAIAAAVTIAFYTIALGVQIAVADAAPKVVLFAWLASYVTRVTVLGLGAWQRSPRPSASPGSIRWRWS